MFVFFLLEKTDSLKRLFFVIGDINLSVKKVKT